MSKKVLIIGDAMIDTYIYGNVGRVSPEAPVPVITPTIMRQYLGGAANVARNVAALGADASVFFTIGTDKDGDILEKKLHEWNVRCDYLYRDNNLHTINKTRVIGNKQQIVRIDYNDKYELSDESKNKLLGTLEKAINDADIIVISDYGKGTCTEKICEKTIELAKDKPVIVDPKGTNWNKYKGATVITPNMNEVNILTGLTVENEDAMVEKNYGDLYKVLQIKYMLLTRSEKGMSLFGDNIKCHIPVYSHEVFDVSGAGDTVVASLAVYMSLDANNIVEASRISNVAAGLVVTKPGTAVVTREEVQKQLLFDSCTNPGSKIYTLNDYDELRKLLALWRTAGNTIVTANGCFDILHRGHIKLLKDAKRHGDKLIVAINSDESVKRLKGDNRPINNELDRAFVISAIDAVDAVVIFDPYVMPCELTKSERQMMSPKALSVYREAPMAVMKMIMPDIHIKGGDYKNEDIPEAIYTKQLIIVSTEEGYSTTGTIDKMKD